MTNVYHLKYLYMVNICILIYKIYKIFCTVAKHSKDAVNNPPKFKPKLLLPLCNKNSISLCTDKGAMYH